MTEAQKNLFPRHVTADDPGPLTLGSQPCQKCNHAAAAGSNFCPKCGRELYQKKPPGPTNPELAKEPISPQKPAPPTPLEELILAANSDQDTRKTAPVLAPETSPAPQNCNCGEPLPKGAKYCPGCGMQLSKSQPRLCLVHRANGNPDQIVAIAGKELTIGKSPDCNLVITNDEYISRRHARIFETDGMVFLEDLNSSNGTFLRPKRAVILEVGDEILIGTTVFRLEDAGS